jgi:dolichol-phosphate mannosyltransferase
MSGSRSDGRWPVTVVVPTRNEAGNVAELVSRLPPVERVLFVDDSDDDTPAVIRAVAGEADLRVELLHRPRGQRPEGLSGAVTAGMATVVSTWTCVMDGDLQHPPEDVARLFERSSAGDVDLVIASRRNWESINEGLGPVRRAVSSVFGSLAGVLFGPDLHGVSDPLSGFFLVRTDALDLDRLHATGFKILLEILVTHPDLRRDEVGFAFQRRGSGASNGSVTEAARYLRHVVDLRRRSAGGRTVRPARSGSG